MWKRNKITLWKVIKHQLILSKSIVKMIYKKARVVKVKKIWVKIKKIINIKIVYVKQNHYK